MAPPWQRRPQRRRLPLQQKENHGVSDGPPKTLSSRFQALSHLQPAEPPGGAENATGRGCRRPRPPRRQKYHFSRPIRPNKHSRIVLVAPLPEKRKPAISSRDCNGLNTRPEAVC